MSAVRSLRNLAASTSRSVLAQRTVSRSSSLARPVVTQWLSKAVAVGPSRLTTVRAFSVSSPAKGEGECMYLNDDSKKTYSNLRLSPMLNLSCDNPPRNWHSVLLLLFPVLVFSIFSCSRRRTLFEISGGTPV